MIGWSKWAAILGAYWLALGLDLSLSPRIEILGGRPEFLTVLAFCLALHARPAGAATAGFAAGVLSSTISGAGLAAHAISRILAAYGICLLARLQLELRLPVVMAYVGVGTLVSRLLMIAALGPSNLGAWLTGSLFSALYSAILTAGVYPLVRRIVAAKEA